MLFSCFPCFSWFRRKEDPERQRLFPPPETVLTPPRPRHSLPPLPRIPSNSSSGRTSPSSTSRTDPKWHGPVLTEGNRERIGSISRAYQGRMRPISQQSLPGSALSSAAPTPHPRQTTFEPLRPAAPGLGRSVSEPRSLAIMALQGIEQSTVGHSASRSRPGRGRPRSATALSGLAPPHSRSVSADTLSYFLPSTVIPDRGRSPGPSSRSARNGSAVHAKCDDSPTLAENQEGSQDVVHHDLGLRDLGGSARHSRRKSKASRRVSTA